MLKARYLHREIQPEGAATTGTSVAVGAKNSFPHGSPPAVQLFFINKAVGNKVIIVMAALASESLLMAIKLHGELMNGVDGVEEYWHRAILADWRLKLFQDSSGKYTRPHWRYNPAPPVR